MVWWNSSLYVLVTLPVTVISSERYGYKICTLDDMQKLQLIFKFATKAIAQLFQTDQINPVTS